MGLWDWVWEKLSGSSAGGQASECASAPGGERTPSGSAVATIEPASAVDSTPQTKEEAVDPVDAWWMVGDDAPTEPQEMERPDLSTEARAFENLLISHFDGHDLEVPPLPRVPQAVLRRLRDRDCDFNLVARDISEDQVIAAAVLRTANSPLYRGMNKITQIPAAVTRLGKNALRTLMMHESLHASVFQSKGVNRELAELIWSRAEVSAWIMRAIAKHVQLDPEDAFLIGLLHDIGNVMVLRLASRARPSVHYAVDAATFEYLCRESHQEFGELIADAWKLPPRLASLIANHHSFPKDNDPYRTERLALILADMIAAMLGWAPPATYNLLQSRPATELGLADKPDFADWLTQLPDEIEQQMAGD